MAFTQPQSRREFFAELRTASMALLAAGFPVEAFADGPPEIAVNPVEDLMREHGVLRRILLIYEEALRRIDGNLVVPEGAIRESAGIVRSFVEDYHEKLEEEELFPRFQKAGRLVDLVQVLYAQHQAGRRLTDMVLHSLGPAARGDADAKRALSQAMKRFIRMYRPHADREDTVLFSAFRMLVSPKEFDDLGEKFEDKEEDLFGKEGFERMVVRVAGIEVQLGIYELSAFTPRL